jgi:hypothetical protein
MWVCSWLRAAGWVVSGRAAVEARRAGVRAERRARTAATRAETIAIRARPPKKDEKMVV